MPFYIGNSRKWRFLKNTFLIRDFEKKYPMLRCTEISQFLIDPPDFGIKVCQKVQINRSNTKLFQKTRILPVNGPLYPDSLDF